MTGDPFMETSTENKDHNASERWQRQQSRCRFCLLYNDLVLHADVQLLLEAWGMSSYAGKHCTQQPIQLFFPQYLFCVPPSLDTVYSNRCQFACVLCLLCSVIRPRFACLPVWRCALQLWWHLHCNSHLMFQQHCIWMISAKENTTRPYAYFCRCCLVAKSPDSWKMGRCKPWSAEWPCSVHNKPSDSRRPRWLAIWPTHVKAF